MNESRNKIDILFNPQNVAIYKASEKLDYFLMGFKEHKYNDSKIYLINPDVDVSVLSDAVNIDVSKVKGNSVCFDSIGKFNCINDSFVIEKLPVEPVPYNLQGLVGQEFQSVEQALFHIFLLIFWLVLALIVFTVKGKSGDTIQIFNILQMIVGLVAGSSFMKFSFIVGFGVLFVAVGIFVGLNLQRS